MKKNLLLLSILLGMGFFNDNNAISNNELLGLFGRSAQTAVGSTAIGMSVLATFLMTAVSLHYLTPLSITQEVMLYGNIRIVAPYVAVLGLLGALETYQGVKGLRKNIRKIQNKTETHSE